MKLCRFEVNGSVVDGIFDNGIVTADENRYPINDVRLLSPVTPSKIVCVGRNYAEHAKELGNEIPSAPLLFFKAPSSIIVDGETIVLPSESSQVEHEGELAVVISNRCKDLDDNVDLSHYILGYSCLNDVTARDLQRKDGQFARAKSFDSFCPIGPFIETELDTTDLEVTVFVNDEIRQHGRTSQMIFSVDYLVRYISRQMTLLPGDVIATGTPAGVSKMNSGDICKVEIEGLEPLNNPIR